MTSDEKPQDPSPPQPPWEQPENFPKPLEGHDYGYLKGKKLHASSRDELVRLCRKSGFSHPGLVWTPESGALVPPQEVPVLIDAEKRRAKLLQRVNLVGGAIWLLAGGFILLLTLSADLSPPDLYHPSSDLPEKYTKQMDELKERRREIAKLLDDLRLRFFQEALLFGLLGAVIAAQATYGLWRIRRRPAAVMAAEAVMARFRVWFSKHRTPFTWGTAACILVAFLCQLPADPSHAIEAAGLVKPAVMRGEYWRLLTCAMLHGNGAHLFFNLVALIILGKLTEVLTHRSYVVLLFVLSVLLGSIFSLGFLPDTTSIGASGGILGLIGFVLVLGYRRRGSLPPRLVRGLLGVVVLVAATGAAAPKIIDNAAHLGGLVCGIVLGMLLIERGIPRWPMPAKRFVVIAGTASACLVPAIAALAIWKMFQ